MGRRRGWSWGGIYRQNSKTFILSEGQRQGEARADWHKGVGGRKHHEVVVGRMKEGGLEVGPTKLGMEEQFVLLKYLFLLKVGLTNMA